MLLWLLNKLFPCEEINGHGRCPTYLFRWRLLSTPWFKVYLHRFVGEDWSRDLHDHPKRFVSVGVWGGYVEHTPAGNRKFLAPWVRTFPAQHRHRITLAPGCPECWTLVAVSGAVRAWGFWVLGKWVHWKTYVGGPLGDAAKACP